MRQALRLVAALVALAGLPAPAAAYVYPTEIDVSSDRDIWELFYNEDIDDVDRDRLLDLWDRGVDPNRAGVDELYELPGVTKAMAEAIVELREKKGPFSDADDLEPALPDDVLEQAEPFLRLAGVERPWFPGAKGDLKLVGVWGKTNRSVYGGPTAETATQEEGADSAFETSQAVNGYLRARAEVGEMISAGVVVSWRERLDRPESGEVAEPADARKSSPSYSFLSKEPGDQAVLDHVYVKVATTTWEVLAGSYRAGFGQGLAFNTSGRRSPHGFYDNLVMNADEDGAKVRVTEREFGLAGRYRKLDVGPGWLDLTAFGSYAQRDLDQYSFSPNTIIQIDAEGEQVLDDGEPVTLAHQRLADGLQETVGGANVTMRLSKRTHFGLTGWAGTAAAAVETDDRFPATFKQNSEFPAKGAFGAAGLDGAVGWEWLDVGVEVAAARAACDEVPAEWPEGFVPGTLCGGERDVQRAAVAAVASVWGDPVEWLDGQLDLWYYPKDYLNPHSAAVGGSGTFLGNGKRNQAGGSARFAVKPMPLVKLRAAGAVWKKLEADPALELTKDQVVTVLSPLDLPDCARYTRGRWSDSAGAYPGDERDSVPATCRATANADLRLRAEVKPTALERVAVEWSWRDKDLGRSGDPMEVYAGDGGADKLPVEIDGASYAFDPDSAGTRQHVKLKVASARLPKTKLDVEALYRWYDRALWGCGTEAADEREDDGDVWAKCPKGQLVPYDSAERDVSLALVARFDLRPGPRVVARAKYLDERIFGGDSGDFNNNRRVWPADQRGETSIDAYLHVQQQLAGTLTLSVRYRTIYLLDDRDSTSNPYYRAGAAPRFNPEHSALATLEMKF